ncbi:5613_t:CDS:2 [Rhizophagus irregularis]|nr:5613_t:CDS:2 [Rhizophagus irregularis]
MSNTVSWLENSISDGSINHFNYSDFKDIKSIGSGSSGDVYCATWKNRFIALKSYNNDEQTLEKVVKEIKFHRRVDIHENILRFYGITRETAAVASLTQQTVKAYKSAQYNKKTCAALIERVQAAEIAVQALNRRKQENESKFRKQSYYISFEKFVAILREIRTFVQDVTHLSGYRKFNSSDHIKIMFQQLIIDFDNIVGDLQLSMVNANDEERRIDIEILQEDMFEMTTFLEKIEGGVTTFDKKISNVFEHILTLKNKSSERGFNPIINKIDSNELFEPIDSQGKVVNKYKIHKKRYRGQDVACKIIDEYDQFNKNDQPWMKSKLETSLNKVRAELAILSNLGKCDYIINFYGLCEMDGNTLGVFGWTENGNLKELYEKFDIGLSRKLKIALNICRGITFLHGCRALHDNATHVTQIIRWLAPERMNSKKINQEIAKLTQQVLNKEEGLKEGNEDEHVPYTIQCEIFSFGMLLWELAFQKIPYLRMEISEIQKHVLNGEREKVKFVHSKNSHGVEKEYGNIIKAAWQSDPSLRPELSYLFNDLENLSSTFTSEDSNGGLKPKKNEIEIASIDLRPGTPEVGIEQIISPMMKLEDGITAHKNGDREKAYDCFVKHAEINNKVAKYWLGYYYLEGYIVEKSLQKAIELFKESADRGVPDAQLRYAFALSEISPRKFNVNEFVRYLTMAANNENHAAQYNLGDLYYNGKLGIPKNEEKGLSYLKLAAIKGQPKARAMLDKLKINHFV